jgi:DNA ligase 1
MHGEEWNGKQDIKGWWMSEKYDGIRGYWNGNKLLSRHGKEINCPNWFIKDLPSNIELDGELWMGRNTFEKLNTLMKSNNENDWKLVKFMIFDLPKSKEIFELRIEEMKKLILPSHVIIVNHEICKGNDHMWNKMKSITSENGEGLILNEPNSYYINERTNSLLKVKVKII